MKTIKWAILTLLGLNMLGCSGNSCVDDAIKDTPYAGSSIKVKAINMSGAIPEHLDFRAGATLFGSNLGYLMAGSRTEIVVDSANVEMKGHSTGTTFGSFVADWAYGSQNVVAYGDSTPLKSMVFSSSSSLGTGKAELYMLNGDHLRGDYDGWFVPAGKTLASVGPEMRLASRKPGVSAKGTLPRLSLDGPVDGVVYGCQPGTRTDVWSVLVHLAAGEKWLVMPTSEGGVSFDPVPVLFEKQGS